MTLLNDSLTASRQEEIGLLADAGVLRRLSHLQAEAETHGYASIRAYLSEVLGEEYVGQAGPFIATDADLRQSREIALKLDASKKALLEFLLAWSQRHGLLSSEEASDLLERTLRLAAAAGY